MKPRPPGIRGRRSERRASGPPAPPEDSPGPPPARTRVWKVLQVIGVGGRYLEDRGVESGRLDAEYLLAHVLGTDRLHLYLHFDRPLGAGELSRFKQLLRRRAAREPLQYVMGSAAFRDLELEVRPGVAIPRPETEYLIDVVSAAAGRDRVFDAALDVGTGSGCIAIALAGEGLARAVTATDISEDALEVARRNAGDCGQPGIDFRQGALLEPVAGLTFDLIISNPPYLAEEEWVGAQPEVREWEPRVAMVAADGGLAVIRSLVTDLEGVLRPGGVVGLEVGPSQADTVAGLLEECSGLENVAVHEDLAGRPRYVLAGRERTGDPSPLECGADSRHGPPAHTEGD